MAIDYARQLIARWPDPDPAHAPVLKRAGVQAVLLDAPHAAFEQACAAAGMQTGLAKDAPLITRGLWPGIRTENRRGRSDDETASASREPWVDSNGYLAAFERTLNPAKPALLGYAPNPGDRMVPFDTLELALIEARVSGGNFALAVEPRFRAALLKEDKRAVDAWASLGRTATWLANNAALFAAPAMPVITALVEAGGFTSEIANLLYRRGASPALAPAANPPTVGAVKCLSACGLKPLAPALWKRVLAHAESGATVVIDFAADPSWKQVKQDRDRVHYAVGRGSVIAYQKRIADPSEFALDCIDIVTHRHRAIRTWNAPSVIPVAFGGGASATAALINYGSPTRDETQVRVLGSFASAELLRPGKAAVKLKTAKRGATTEVFVPEVERLAVVRLGR